MPPSLLHARQRRGDSTPPQKKKAREEALDAPPRKEKE